MTLGDVTSMAGMKRMTVALRVEAVLEAATARAEADHAPPKLAAALRYAIFPGGARVRPRLCLAIAAACGDDHPAMSDAAAAAIEFLHCASLVHDDLPCFDDAKTRRGKPSVHAMFGQPLAVLAGDAMIVMAFEGLARAGASAPTRLPGLLSTIARGVGMPGGIVAGQAWESEPFTPVEPYHRAKTGALFVAATTAGALAAGADPGPWRELGEKLGAAYQVADDLADAVSTEHDCGKPTGQDAALQRPSLVAKLGLKGAYSRLESLVAEAVAAIPPCEGAKELRDLVQMQAVRLAPKQPARSAA
jgi:geranylgeranyl diphosphate synthase type II